ncbi:MAG TPA: hypothetical protein VKV41_20675 [Methylomirabilota bacterium]|jgi:hypothetical protein|nr:hypothetical protein [Methylomirabilota bacterium]
MRSRAGLVAGLVLALVTSAGAQAPVPEVQTTESRGLRIQWTVEPQTRDFNAVCGHIYNDQRVSARNVSLMVQSVDNDRVVSRNIPNVAREIVGQSGFQFCGTVLRAPAYRVIVTEVDWDTTQGQ